MQQHPDDGMSAKAHKLQDYLRIPPLSGAFHLGFFDDLVQVAVDRPIVVLKQQGVQGKTIVGVLLFRGDHSDGRCFAPPPEANLASPDGVHGAGVVVADDDRLDSLDPFRIQHMLAEVSAAGVARGADADHHNGRRWYAVGLLRYFRPLYRCHLAFLRCRSIPRWRRLGCPGQRRISRRATADFPKFPLKPP